MGNEMLPKQCLGGDMGKNNSTQVRLDFNPDAHHKLNIIFRVELSSRLFGLIALTRSQHAWSSNLFSSASVLEHTWMSGNATRFYQSKIEAIDWNTAYNYVVLSHFLMSNPTQDDKLVCSLSVTVCLSGLQVCVTLLIAGWLYQTSNKITTLCTGSSVAPSTFS